MDQGLQIDLSTPNLPIEIQRGVSPEILLSQIDVTVPYLWTDEIPVGASFGYFANLKKTREWIQKFPDTKLSLDHAEYYSLCLAAHYTTAGSYVPTDVDNQIRFRLWHPALPLDAIAGMVDAVDACRNWDIRPVCARWVLEEESGEILSGHNGEWFSVAAGAYGATRKKIPARAKLMASHIAEEIAREAEIYKAFRNRGDGISLLKASTLIAHNLGDLDRVLTLWGITDEDPVRQMLANALSTKYEKGILVEAGALNTALMAAENHRHFALRAAKPLRRGRDFLLPIGPFFDSWGHRVARHPLLAEEDVGKIAEVLIDGWGKLKGAVGYARALKGIEEGFKGGLEAVSRHLPSRIEKIWKTGELRRQCSVDLPRFESQWKQMALKFVRDYKI